MGVFKIKEPKVPKEFVRPAYMIKASADTLTLTTPSENTPQTTANPFVQAWKSPCETVLKILEPASEQSIQTSYYCFQALPLGSFGFPTYGVHETFQALVTRPTVEFSRVTAPFEVITEKIKTVSRFREVGYACLLGMQGQTSLPQQLCKPGQRCFPPLPGCGTG